VVRSTSWFVANWSGLSFLTPTTDTNEIGCHDPLPDTYKLSPQVSDHLGRLYGIF